jgi:hypothetical protein
MAEKITLPLWENMVVREAAVDEVLSPQSSLELAINVHGDRIGTLQGRSGTTLLGTQLVDNTPILGMGLYRNNAGTVYGALAKVGTVVKAYLGASWANVRTGLTATSKARFTNFVDYTFMVNGNANEAMQTWGGTGNFSTTDTTNAPKGDFIDNYRSRIWVVDKSTDKAYYSDVVTTSNTITWPVAPQYIQISPADGENVTGIKRDARALLVFKQNHIYKIASINEADPDPSISKGTYSQESIVEAKNGIYYHHPSGFYKFVFDGEQEEISRPIIDIIKAIPRANYENISGWADDDHIYWSIGDVTLNGVSYTNLVCRRTISTQIWTIYSYPTEIRSTVVYDNGTTLTQLLGDDDGNVLQFDTGTTDNGSPINYDIISHWMYFTSNRQFYKSFSKILQFHENAQGLKLSYQVDTDNQKNTNNAWTNIGDIKRDLYEVFSCNVKNCTRFRLRITGSGTGTPFILRGTEIVDLTTQEKE